MTETLPDQSSDRRDIYSVSEINRHLKQLLGSAFPLLWVEGEISNLARPASGHIYFSLKDQSAQIRCVMFRGSQKNVPFKIENGLQVIIRAKLGLYEPRGDLQLIVDEMEVAGFGALQRQFEALKQKLFAEGLFSSDQKKDIPNFPDRIALITSPSGAAVKDFLKVIRRRFPLVHISLYAAPVQGEQAAKIIQSAIQSINRDHAASVIAIIRGGGSIEDLWPFNDEQLARSIAASSIPVVTGVGHEIDYTIADFVADLRAPTPSVAAEMIAPDLNALQSTLREQTRRLRKSCRSTVNNEIQKIDWLYQRLQRIHPASNIRQQSSELRRFSSRLFSASRILIERSRHRLSLNLTKLQRHSPIHGIRQAQLDRQLMRKRLQTAANQILDRKKHKFQLTTTTLNAISPLHTLDRGYSITIIPGTKPTVIRHYKQTQTGDQLVTYLAAGQVVSRVESTSSDNTLETFKSSKPSED